MKSLLKTVIISAITVVVTFHILIRTFGNVPDKDIRGYTPVTLLDHYIALCQEGKIDEAVSLWTPESLDRNPDLKEYSQKIGTLNLDYSGTSKGKLDTILFISADIIGDKNSFSIFYFELRDSNWHLHYPQLIRTD